MQTELEIFWDLLARKLHILDFSSHASQLAAGLNRGVSYLTVKEAIIKKSFASAVIGENISLGQNCQS